MGFQRYEAIQQWKCHQICSYQAQKHENTLRDTSFLGTKGTKYKTSCLEVFLPLKSPVLDFWFQLGSMMLFSSLCTAEHPLGKETEFIQSPMHSKMCVSTLYKWSLLDLQTFFIGKTTWRRWIQATKGIARANTKYEILETIAPIFKARPCCFIQQACKQVRYPAS